MTKLLYKSFAAAGADQFLWSFHRDRLRILCYHGVCADELAGAPWLPHYFVTVSRFRQQLDYLGRHAHVLPLTEAVARLSAGSLPARSVAITFDDGYANNLHVACPLLKQYGMPASIFVSTFFVESGEIFSFLKLKLIRAGAPSAPAIEYKSASADTVMRYTNAHWDDVRPGLTSDVIETLRPMRPDELCALDPGLIDIGGHTHTHCILANETDNRRREEIGTSIRSIAQWTGRPVRTFSYPNGQARDFGSVDKQALAEHGISIAVSGIAGANSRDTNTLELRRYPVGLFHDGGPSFSAEVTGFRTAMRAVTGLVS